MGTVRTHAASLETCAVLLHLPSSTNAWVQARHSKLSIKYEVRVLPPLSSHFVRLVLLNAI